MKDAKSVWAPGLLGLGLLALPVATLGPARAAAGLTTDATTTTPAVTLDAVGDPVVVGLDVRPNERWIDVPGSPVVLRLWDQITADGEVVPHYSISLDGSTYAASRSTSYTIHLRYAPFDPMVEIPAINPRLQAPADNTMYLVQFVTQPLEEYRRDIRSLGGTIYDFMSNHSYLISMDASVRETVEALPYVRWVGAFHPAYKLDEQMRNEHFPYDYRASGAAVEKGDAADRDLVVAASTILGGGVEGNGNEADPTIATYNIMVFERGPAQKRIVADRVRRIGGRIDHLIPEGFLLRATLTIPQLEAIISLNEVAFMDLWGPYEPDMDIARRIGGADYVEQQAGFTGKGVRGEIHDTGIRLTHQEFQAPQFIEHGSTFTSSHGTSVSGIVFATGINPTARGMLPDGQGIFLTANSSSRGFNRPRDTAELVDPNGPYRGVFQTNSTGDPRTRSYTTVSSEMDDILFNNDVLIGQSQSNAGNQDSRPQAWAKNMVSVGGVRHQDTLDKSDDCWCSSGSIGPAADGRIKPTLTHFYDWIFTTSSSCDTCYTSSFGGTSGATPITIGHFGVMFQMWHEETFPGFGGAATVFDSRPHMSTAKALMVNSADQYPFSGPGHDHDRSKQGWGMADLKQLYDDRNRMFIINETDILQNMEVAIYTIVVNAGEPDFRATLVYSDPKGVPFSNKHRINDLTLKVSSPSGLVYWGNVGLLDGVWSATGGAANDIDTVENVFVQNPEAGTWIVEIQANEVVEDAHVETPEVDADFALVVVGGTGQGSLALTVGDLRWGKNATLKAVNADPDDTVFFIYSTAGPGSTFVPQLGITLDLKNPVLGGQAIADAGGVATLNKVLPNRGGVMGIWIQAAKVGEKSNLVATFVAP